MSSPESQDVIKILDRLRAVLAVRNDTELATKLGVTQSTIPTWKRRGTLNHALVIAKCHEIGVSLDWIFAGEGDPNRTTTRIERAVAMSSIWNIRSKLTWLRERLGTAGVSETAELLEGIDDAMQSSDRLFEHIVELRSQVEVLRQVIVDVKAGEISQ